MSEKKEIKQGDLVTIELGEFQISSNTYRVFGKIDSFCILNHPLAPECFLLREESELNNAFPSMQSQVEKCLAFAKKNKGLLGLSMAGDLDALCYYFVVKKEFTDKQRFDVSNICGKISTAILGGSIISAITLIKQNKVLLDEHNNYIMNSVKKLIENPLLIKEKRERFTIFNLAGFILAQLSNT